MVKKGNEDGNKVSTKKVEDEETSVPKKRGRKPRGGKLVSRDIIDIDTRQMQTNIILNLKCSMKDLETADNLTNVMSNTLVYVPEIPPTVKSYDTTGIEYSIYDETAEKSGKVNNSRNVDINMADTNDECISNKPNFSFFIRYSC